MTSLGLLFSSLSALCIGIYTVFAERASQHIHALLAATLISVTGAVFGGLLIAPQFKHVTANVTTGGIALTALVGLTVIGVDYFIFKAYQSGLPVSVVGSITIAGGAAVAAVAGLLLGESITVFKAVGIFLVIGGSVILGLATK